MKRMITVLIALAVLLSFAACGGKSNSGNTSTIAPSDETGADLTEETVDAATEAATLGEPTPIDKGWLKLDMPAGYIEDSPADYVSLIFEADPNKTINIARDMLPGVELDVLVDDQVSQGGSRGEDYQAAGYEWKVVNRTTNGKDSCILFAQLDELFYVRATLFGLTPQDDAVRQVFESLVIDNTQ